MKTPRPVRGVFLRAVSRRTAHVGAAEGCDLLILFLILEKAKSRDRSLRQLLHGFIVVAIGR
jgi:hypothetical protein